VTEKGDAAHAMPDTRLVWADAEPRPLLFYFEVFGLTPHDVSLSVWADQSRLPAAEVEDFLFAVERLLVAAERRDVPARDIGELAGLSPVWVRPDIDRSSGLPTAVPVHAVATALREHPDACGVILGDPSYIGTTGDVAGHARVAHAAGVPLIVDAAWAAHFGFHPDLPPHALAAGADAMVTSAHKALPAYTQAALVSENKRLAAPASVDDLVKSALTTGSLSMPMLVLPVGAMELPLVSSSRKP